MDAEKPKRPTNDELLKMLETKKQKEVAEELGVTPQTIRNWLKETNEETPKPKEERKPVTIKEIKQKPIIENNENTFIFETGKTYKGKVRDYDLHGLYVIDLENGYFLAIDNYDNGTYNGKITLHKSIQEVHERLKPINEERDKKRDWNRQLEDRITWMEQEKMIGKWSNDILIPLKAKLEKNELVENFKERNNLNKLDN